MLTDLCRSCFSFSVFLMDAGNSATDIQTNITIIMWLAVLSADCVCVCVSVHVFVGMRKIHSI